MARPNSPRVRRRSKFPTSDPRKIILGRAHFGFVGSVVRASAAKCIFSKDSEKSPAGEICRLEGRHSRKIVSPPLVGMSNFYNEFDNFFKGRSSSMARPGQERSEIHVFYDDKCAPPFRPMSLINRTRLHATCLLMCGLRPKAVIPS